MNKLLGMVMVLAVAFSGLFPGMAVDEASAAQSFHVRFSGNSAHSVWSSCGFSQPEAGETCTDTYVFATDQAIRDRGNKSAYTVLYIDEYTYTVDEEGSYIPVSWRNGYSEAAQFSASKKLTSASAAGDVPMQECTVLDPSTWEVSCMDPVVVSVEILWTGQGPLLQIRSNFSQQSKDFKSSYRSRSSYRDATATSSLVAGSPIYATIFNSQDSSMTICHVYC